MIGGGKSKVGDVSTPEIVQIFTLRLTFKTEFSCSIFVLRECVRGIISNCGGIKIAWPYSFL